MSFIKRLILFIINYLKNIFMAKKILFSQDLVTDPSGYRIAIGKNTEEDTKNFDAGALINNLKIKKYSVSYDDFSVVDLGIPLGTVIWDMQLHISTDFDADVSFTVSAGAPVVGLWSGISVAGFHAADVKSLPVKVSALSSPVLLTSSMDGNDPETGVADLYVQYSV
jgi:hypothetical protein